MAKKCSSLLRQHLVLPFEDIPIFSTAVIAAIVDNGHREASIDIMLVPGSYKRPIRTYLLMAFFIAKNSQILVF